MADGADAGADAGVDAGVDAGADASAQTFDEARLLEEACSRTGLDDFGDEGFREPLGRLLRSLRDEAPLNELGRATFRQRLLESLECRLTTQYWITKHPEILDEEIGGPLVVVGLMRTGTTMLQRMLASDPRHHAAMWWETRFPAPPPGVDWNAPDPRIAPAEAEVAAILEADPRQASIHPWDALAPDEEILLLEHSFLSHVPESFTYVPGYRDWLDEQDWTPAYRHLETQLKFLQWQKRQRGTVRERWVLKTPGHLGYLDTLFEVFPEARVIQTHRDPLETIPSSASMNHSLWALYGDVEGDNRAGPQVRDRLAWAMQRCLETRARMPADRFCDVWFRDALEDPMGEIARAYALFGIELTPAAKAAIEAWRAAHPRDRRPPHEYTMADYGLTPESIESAFAEYRARFIAPRA